MLPLSTVVTSTTFTTTAYNVPLGRRLILALNVMVILQLLFPENHLLRSVDGTTTSTTTRPCRSERFVPCSNDRRYSRFRFQRTFLQSFIKTHHHHHHHRSTKSSSSTSFHAAAVQRLRGGSDFFDMDGLYPRDSWPDAEAVAAKLLLADEETNGTNSSSILEADSSTEDVALPTNSTMNETLIDSVAASIAPTDPDQSEIDETKHAIETVGRESLVTSTAAEVANSIDPNVDTQSSWESDNAQSKVGGDLDSSEATIEPLIAPSIAATEYDEMSYPQQSTIATVVSTTSDIEDDAMVDDSDLHGSVDVPDNTTSSTEKQIPLPVVTDENDDDSIDDDKNTVVEEPPSAVERDDDNLQSTSLNDDTAKTDSHEAEALGDVDREIAPTNSSEREKSEHSTFNANAGQPDMQEARQLRGLGKDYHDQGDFPKAAHTFGEAADFVLSRIQVRLNEESEDDNVAPALEHGPNASIEATDKVESDDDGDSALEVLNETSSTETSTVSTPTEVATDSADTTSTLVLEYCTLRLHQALCALKAHEYELAVVATTAVIDFSVSATRTHGDVVLVVPAALRARALYRRAKARLGQHEQQEVNEESESSDETNAHAEVEDDNVEDLDDVDSTLSHSTSNSDNKVRQSMAALALSDARAAAFLGDGKAVAMYGKLLRSNSNLMDDSKMEASVTKSIASGSSSTNSLLDLFSSTVPSSGESSASTPGGSTSSSMTSLLSSMLLGNANGKKQGGDMAKSMWNMALQRIDDPSTQDTICSFLQKTSETQLLQWSSLAGMSLPSTQAQRIVKFCHSVTPKLLRSVMTMLKRVVYVVQLFRHIGRVIRKYRMLIVLWILLWWIKSALLMPLPIRGGRKARAILQQAAAAASAATTATVSAAAATSTTTTPSILELAGISTKDTNVLPAIANPAQAATKANEAPTVGDTDRATVGAPILSRFR